MIINRFVSRQGKTINHEIRHAKEKRTEMQNHGENAYDGPLRAEGQYVSRQEPWTRRHPHTNAKQQGQ